MTNLDILLLVIITGLSIGIAIFQYRENLKKKEKTTYLFITLRSFILILIGLLLLDLAVTSSTTKIIKPQLAVLVDNSSSIKEKVDVKNIKNDVNSLQTDQALNDRFSINTYQFGDQFKTLDSLGLNDQKTDVYKGLSTLNSIYKNDQYAVILMSDGHQNYGQDFAYYANNQSMNIFPVALGDTTAYQDLKINRINVNYYSYLGNKFPVEILVNYDGQEEIKTRLRISNGNQTLFSKALTLSKNKKSVIVNTKIQSELSGLQSYKVSLSPITDEKNTDNNKTSFQIDIIDDQTKILLLTSIIHPDLGGIKKSIETNQQRQVIIKTADEFDGKFDDYQSVILYQPQASFNRYINQLKKKNASLFIIGGTKTDYRFLNQKFPFLNKTINQATENYQGVYNSEFQKFQFDDLGFDDFPPLENEFGEVEISGDYSTLLYQSIDGIPTKNPLLFEKSTGDKRYVFLLGEGVWKWRSATLTKRKTFRPFDKFLDKIIQYLNVDDKARLEVEAEKLYKSGFDNQIIARYYDANYQFDPRAELNIQIIDSTGAKQTYDMPLINNQYNFDVNTLDSGIYNFKVSVENQPYDSKGRFRIMEFSLENNQYGANLDKLKSVSNDEKIYTSASLEDLKEALLENEKFQPIQKSTQNKKSLINWYYLLVLLIVFLGLEWLLRKYNGLI
ncbi:MAG: VWA domain-containing protein [Psychroflexus sp.]|nr:VWA domain-containing protein [Psychroflexus sp.]MDR9448671.1 VWA domain-containing protein [Psychroflexus sp.]